MEVSGAAASNIAGLAKAGQHQERSGAYLRVPWRRGMTCTLKTKQCMQGAGKVIIMRLNFSVTKAKTTKPRVKPGTYDSVVTNVGYSEKHVKGKAIRVDYELVAKDGTQLQHHEYFFFEDWNKRTRDLAKYLNDHGIPFEDTDEIIEDIMGLREELVIKKSTSGKGLMTIESRKFLGKAE